MLLREERDKWMPTPLNVKSAISYKFDVRQMRGKIGMIIEFSVPATANPWIGPIKREIKRGYVTGYFTRLYIPCWDVKLFDGSEMCIDEDEIRCVISG